MAQKIIITKKGYDAVDESAQKNLIFDSALNHLKTALSGSKELTAEANATASHSFDHGLAIRPLVVAYFRDTSDTKWYVTMTQVEVTSVRKSTWLNVHVYVDTTKVYFLVINRTASQKTVEIQYEVFFEGDA